MASRPRSRGGGRIAENLDNPGGRDQWISRMVAHHKNLAAICPTVDCWPTRPHTPRRMTKGYGGYHTAESYDEVLRLQRKIEEIHGPGRHVRISGNPGSRQLAEQLSRNRQASALSSHAAAGDTAHRANLKNMLRRIDDLASLQERSKNRFDTSVYPALLLRRRDELPPGQLLEHQLAAAAARAARSPTSASPRQRAAALNARAEVIVSDRLRARLREMGRETERTAGARPRSASAGRRAAPAEVRVARTGAASSRAARSQPRAEVIEHGEYDEYSARVIKAIVESRIYNETDLRTFLRRAMGDVRYAHLDPAELKARTHEVAAEFFCRLD
ncbi:hypothetical protein T492DRAFT_1089992 [Pavlovales sp. CCMP2436]|nr:hypothetical protein T492DRAFT_1089992 [Pavlovales sp. CCMP2436]